MIEIYCIECKTLIGHQTYCGPTGFFYCLDCGRVEREKEENEKA